MGQQEMTALLIISLTNFEVSDWMSHTITLVQVIQMSLVHYGGQASTIMNVSLLGLI